ncbi:MAG: MFS transporter [Acidimicrobiales bacterium]|nr:MFS transporter [Acidimicrobiales bacterium]
MSSPPSPLRPGFGASTERDPRKPWSPSAFSRLARAHAAGVAGDALFAMGLAGTVFFSLDFDSARWRVALYLVLTIAPFAVAAPLIGPALDRIRGGRRWIIVGSMGMRAVLCVLVVLHLDSLLFYPEAFGMLVLAKVYTISKSAVVPGTVRNDTELVEANSKLTVLSALAVVVAVVPGGILLALGGAQWALGLAAIVFAVATGLALKLPPTQVAVEPEGEAEREELRSAGIFLAGTSMAVIRGIVGFLSFMLAFAFKNAGAPLWQLGVVAATAQLGFFVGAVVAPRLRRLLSEERILVGALVVTAVGGALTAMVGGLPGAAILSMVVGATGSSAKQAFDSIVQRDAPDANRGRSFARFETRFQLVWVLGALVPIVIPVPATVGFAMIGLASTVTVVWYLVGMRRVRQGRVPVRRRGWRRHPIYGPDAEPDPAAATRPVAEPAVGPPPPSTPPPPPPFAGRAQAAPPPADHLGRSSLFGTDPTVVDEDRTVTLDPDRTVVVDDPDPTSLLPDRPDRTPPRVATLVDPARRWMPASPPPPHEEPTLEGQGLLFSPDDLATAEDDPTERTDPTDPTDPT